MAPAGSVDEICQRLLLWCRRSESGLARVEFHSEGARRAVLAGVRSALTAEGIPFHQLPLHAWQRADVAALVDDLLERLHALSPGVVSLDGFAAALPQNAGELAAALYRFNLQRERFAAARQRQIWWMPPHFAAAFVRAVPDLDSWFLVRLYLTETRDESAQESAAQAEVLLRAMRSGPVTTGRPLGMDEVARTAQRSARAHRNRSAGDTRLAASDLQRLAADYSERYASGKAQGLSESEIAPLLEKASELWRGARLDVLDGNDTVGQRGREAAAPARDAATEMAGDAAGDSPGKAPPDLPEQAPRIIRLPLRSLGSLFVGRDEELAELARRFGDGPTTAVPGRAYVIHGENGVGKTRLALEYAYACAGAYRQPLFAGAASAEALRHNLATLCGPAALDLPEQDDADENRQFEAVMGWLGRHPGWLLIVDGVDSPQAAAAAEALRARLVGGHLLLTSRLSPAELATWRDELAPRPLARLVPPHAVAFLLAHSAAEGREQAENHNAAVDLARDLGGLPLALELAGAAMGCRRQGLLAYCADWRDRRERHARPHVQRDWYDEDASAFPRSLLATWQISLDRLGEVARSLLRRLVWLAPEPIPEALCETLPCDGGQGFTAADGQPPLPVAVLRSALAELAHCSLIIKRDDTPAWAMHELLQEIGRQQQFAHARHATTSTTLPPAPPPALRSALAWLDAAFAGDAQDARHRSRLDALAAHALAVARRADQAGITEPTARLLRQLGLLLRSRSRYHEAEPLLRRALALEEASFGPAHPSVAMALDDLALLLHDANRLPEAETLFRRALGIALASLGDAHPTAQRMRENLVRLLRAQGRREDQDL